MYSSKEGSFSGTDALTKRGQFLLSGEFFY
jgi:hypothetical protein